MPATSTVATAELGICSKITAVQISWSRVGWGLIFQGILDGIKALR